MREGISKSENPPMSKSGRLVLLPRTKIPKTNKREHPKITETIIKPLILTLFTPSKSAMKE